MMIDASMVGVDQGLLKDDVVETFQLADGRY